MDLLRRDLLGGALATFATIPPCFALAEKIRWTFWSEDEATRIAVETDAKHDYKWHILRTARPYRLFLDINDMKLTPQIEATVKALKADKRYIASIRVGQFQPTVLRIVFDLKDDVNARVAYVVPTAGLGHRIMIEIAAKDIDMMQNLIQESNVDSGESVQSKREIKKTRASAKQEINRAPLKTTRKETLIVVVDPGHGGADPGAVGRKGTYEKNVALAIGKKVAEKINATSGMKAILTRNRDVFIPLYKRANMAVKNRAHLFVSVHADAWTTPKARGSSVFTLSVNGASSLQARWLAQTQNRADEIAGAVFKDVSKTVRSTVVDMLAETKLRYGIQLGDAVLEELEHLGPLHKENVEYAQFAVLKAQGIPSILVETAFISNPKDEARLKNPLHQEKIATAIYTGIKNAVKRDPSLLKQT